MISCDCHRTTVSIGTQTQRNSSKTKVTNCTYMMHLHLHPSLSILPTIHSLPTILHAYPLPHPFTSPSRHLSLFYPSQFLLSTCDTYQERLWWSLSTTHAPRQIVSCCQLWQTQWVNSKRIVQLLVNSFHFFLHHHLWPSIPPFFPGPQGLSGNAESTETQEDFTEICRRFEQLKAKN